MVDAAHPLYDVQSGTLSMTPLDTADPLSYSRLRMLQCVIVMHRTVLHC